MSSFIEESVSEQQVKRVEYFSARVEYGDGATNPDWIKNYFNSPIEIDFVIEYSGWIQVTPQTTFQYIGKKDNNSPFITAAEYIQLSPDERVNYIIEDLAQAIKDSDDGEFTEINLVIEREENYCIDDNDFEYYDFGGSQ
jgi:hypothetical protein